MDRSHISDLGAFVAIGKHLSFRRAATDLGVTPSALSHSLKQLEDRLNIRLINRTTRSVALTEAGQALFGQLRPAFEGISTAVEDLNAYRQAPVGTVRLNVPRAALRHIVLPLIAEFNVIHPQIKFSVAVSNHLVDVVAEGFDAGVRFGELVAEDMIAVPIGPQFNAAVVATSSYFESHGKPRHPKELSRHRCVSYRYPSGRTYLWEFEKGRSRLNVAIEATMTFDDMDCVLDAVLKDVGLGYVFAPQVSALINHSKLERVLEEWCRPTHRFFLYYPGRRHHSYAMRTFLDFLRDRSRT